MAKISAQLVKELRERTGAGMMECKKALVATAGDIETAVDEMRKAGQAKADKKASRTAAEGAIAVKMSEDGKQAVIIEINCETDFVGRDSNFVNFVDQVAATALAHKLDDVEALSALEIKGQSIEQMRQLLIQKIGENIKIRRAYYLDTEGTLGAYVHGGRIGVVVECVGGNSELAKDLAMHIAATSPQVVRPEDVDTSTIDKEKEIFISQAKESGKPDDIIAKMTEGRIKKFVNEISLLGQSYVKDPGMTVADLLKSENAQVERFVRFCVGEGIEKEETDFAQEVLEQTQGK